MKRMKGLFITRRQSKEPGGMHVRSWKAFSVLSTVMASAFLLLPTAAFAVDELDLYEIDRNFADDYTVSTDSCGWTPHPACPSLWTDNVGAATFDLIDGLVDINEDTLINGSDDGTVTVGGVDFVVKDGFIDYDEDNKIDDVESGADDTCYYLGVAPADHAPGGCFDGLDILFGYVDFNFDGAAPSLDGGDDAENLLDNDSTAFKSFFGIDDTFTRLTTDTSICNTGIPDAPGSDCTIYTGGGSKDPDVITDYEDRTVFSGLVDINESGGITTQDDANPFGLYTLKDGYVDVDSDGIVPEESDDGEYLGLAVIDGRIVIGASCATVDTPALASGANCNGTIDFWVAGWEWSENQLQTKNDINSAFAGTWLYQTTSPGTIHQDNDFVLYYGLDLTPGGGSSASGFWLLQDETVGLSLAQGQTNNTRQWVGRHTVGDLLIQINPSNGVANVFVWNPGEIFPGLPPNDSGTPNISQVFSGTDCALGTGEQAVCATANARQKPVVTDPVVWPYTHEINASLGEQYQEIYDDGNLIEGGVNVSAVYRELGITVPCFSKSVVSTRSTESTSGTLTDFMLAEFDSCGLEIRKTGDTVAVVGDTVTFYIEIENTGILPLTMSSPSDPSGLGISDPLVDNQTGVFIDTTYQAALAAGCEVLEPSEICSFPLYYTTSSDDDDPFLNTISTAFLSADGSDVFSAEDDHWVDLVYTGSIGDQVWLDEDGNGVFDAGEDGIPGVTVILTPPAGVDLGAGLGVAITTTTDANGQYTFNGLPGAEYTVAIVAPAGSDATYDFDGGLDNTTTLTLAEGETNTTTDFGLNWVPSTSTDNNTGTGAIGDRVWNDADGDGIQDEGESGIANVGVVLTYDSNGDGVLDAVYAATVTDATGNYIFDDLPAGIYGLVIIGDVADPGTLPAKDTAIPAAVEPAEFDQTGDPDEAGGQCTICDSITSAPIMLSPGDVYLLADFGYQDAAGGTEVRDVEGTVYFDADVDGNNDVGGGPDTGVANVTVSLAQEVLVVDGLLDLNRSGSGADDNGILDGVEVILGKLDLDGDGSITEADDGYFHGYKVIDGYVDVTGDGIDTVGLDNGGTDDDGSLNVIVASTTTDATGDYLFPGVEQGFYSVIVTDANASLVGTYQTGDPDETGLCSIEDGIQTCDSATSFEVSTADVAGLDFGYVPAGHDAGEGLISGTVGLDSIDNDMIDPGEALPGVDVKLYQLFDVINGLVDLNNDGLTDADDVGLLDGYRIIDGKIDFNNDGVIDAADTTLGPISCSCIFNGLGVLDGVLGTPGDPPPFPTPFVPFTGTLALELGTETTDSNGFYDFGGLDPNGQYSVETVLTTLPSGTSNDFDFSGLADDGISYVDLSAVTSGVQTGVDFGIEGTNSLSGTIWNDGNADGTLTDGTLGTVNETSSGLAGVTVELIDSNGVVVATTTTGVDGTYSFTNMPDGTFTVKVTDEKRVLTGYWLSDGPSDGSDNNSQPDPYTVTLNSTNSSDVTADFGYYIDPGVVGNTVFKDLNGNGVQDAGEGGFAGVEVELKITYPDASVVTVVTTTAADGSYSFGNLLLDEDFNGDGSGQPTYELSVLDTQAALIGYLTTESRPGVTDDGLESGVGNGADGDADTAAGTAAFPVQGSADDTNDFGFALPSAIYGSATGLVWLDTDLDGVWDIGEPGIDGVIVHLYEDPDGIPDNGDEVLVGSTVTDANGYYSFPDLEGGNYQVQVEPNELNPGGNLQGLDETAGNDGIFNSNIGGNATFNLTEGENEVIKSLGYVPVSGTAVISGTVWSDASTDGVLDPSEVGIGSVTVQLFNVDGSPVLVGGNPVTAETGPDGSYILTGVPPGDYFVRVITDDAELLDFCDDTVVADCNTTATTSTPISVAADEIASGINFGFDNPAGTYSINDTVWSDLDANALLDGNDFGLGGITVDLYDCGAICGDGDDVIIATVTTNDDGVFNFDGVPEGIYDLVISDNFGVLDDFVETTATGGSAQIEVNETTAGVDHILDTVGDDGFETFGYRLPGTIGGSVYSDADNFGTFDGSESGLAGIVVELRDDQGALVATTLTAADGSYSFNYLDPGSYVVVIPSPPPDTQTGDPDQPGVDCSTSCDNTTTTAIVLNAGESVADLDFGYNNPSLSNVSGTVFNDINENAVYEPDDSETGISGVTMALSPVYDIYNGHIDLDGDPLTEDNGFVSGSINNVAVLGGLLDMDGDGLITADDIGTFNGISVVNGHLDVDGDGLVFIGVNENVGDDNGTVIGDPIATLVTDANGDYEFKDVPEGNYIVAVTDDDNVVDGYTLTSGLDEQDVTAVDGVDVTDVDFGYVSESGTSSIGDSVWLDANGNGINEPNESGLVGVDLTLYADRNNDGTVDTTVGVINNTLDLNNDGVVNYADDGSWYGVNVYDGGLDVNGDGVVNGSDNGLVNGYTITAGSIDGPGISGGAGTIDGAWDTTVTDSNGTYLFSSLPAGSYHVDVDETDIPAALVTSTGTPDISGIINLSENEVYEDADFGYKPAAGTVVLGDVVWYDTNSNGVQDPGEAGIGGVDVQIFDVNTNTVVATVTTNPDGSWLATGLAPGTEYIVTVDDSTLPGGVITTPTNMGGGDTYTTATMVDGDVLTSLDFGYTGGVSGSIGDTVWLDSNHDGIRDAGEPGLSNMGVRLWSTGADGIAGTADDFRVSSTNTDANGEYLFTGLFDGEYYVEMAGNNGGLQATDDTTSTGAGANASTGTTGEITLVAGQQVLDADFGYQPLSGTAVIGDRIWSDADGDGVQDAGEAGIGGATVYLCLQTAPSCDAANAEETVVTRADGSYLFINVIPGDYTVAVDTSTVSGTNTGDPDEGTPNPVPGTCAGCDSTVDITAVADASYTDLDFGYYDPATAGGSIGDLVYNDIDGNGVFDGSDVGVDGVSLDLRTVAIIGSFVDINGDGIIDASDNGSYAGYDVIGGAIDTSGNGSIGPEDNISVYGITVINGQLDVNNDAVVDVLDDQASQLIATTTTAGGGAYEFSGLPEGEYRVTVTDTANVLDALLGSSTVTQTAPTTLSIDCTAGCSTIDTADFGYTAATTATGSIGDLIWFDSDGDGNSTGEAGISGVSLDLVDCGTGTCSDGDESVIETVFTDPNGVYDFSGLDAGNYEVIVTDTAGVLSSLVSSNSPTMPIAISCPTLDTCTDYNDADFGYKPTVGEVGNLGGTIWRDTDKPAGEVGTLQPEESGLEGILVELWLDVDGNGVIEPGVDNLVRTATTDANGDYNFLGLPPGDYIIRVPDDSTEDVTGNLGTNGVLGGMTSVTGPADTADSNGHDNPYAVTLLAGETDTSIDFAYDAVTPLTLSGQVFEDSDGDGGTYIPGTDALGANATVTLYRVVDGIEYLVDTTMSDSNGDYEFVNLPAGDYVVKVDTSGSDVDGLDQTVDWDEPGGVCVTCDSQASVTLTASTSDVNFAYWNGGVVTTPVTLGYFHAQSGEEPGEVTFEWSTVTETGNVGFDIYAQTPQGGLMRINDLMIPAKSGRPVETRHYQFYATDIIDDVFYIVDLDILGVEMQHGPFKLDVPAGVKESQANPTKHEAIQKEHEASEKVRKERKKEKMKQKLKKQKDKLKDKGRWSSQNDTGLHWSTRLAGSVLSLLVGSAHAADLPVADTGLIQLQVTQSGLQRVTYDDLNDAGLDLGGVDADLIAITNQGEPVQIAVNHDSTASKKSFGSGWYIEFLGEPLDTLYTKTNVYTLYLDESRAARVQSDSSRVGKRDQFAEFYLDSKRVEEEKFWSFSSPAGDPWFMAEFRAIVNPLSADFEVSIDAFAGNVAPANLLVELWGVTDWPSETDDHHVLLSFNGAEVANEWFDGLVDYPVNAELAAGGLVEGTNLLNISMPVDTGFVADLVNLNAIEITYPRLFEARDGERLEFTSAGEAFEVKGLLSEDVMVYRKDVDGSVSLLKNVKSESQVDGSFNAQFPGISSDASYHVITESAIRTPGLESPPEELNITSGPASYLVIAHPDFIGADAEGVDPLGDLVLARQADGFTVLLADLEQVYAQFGHGIVDPQAIKDYIAFANQNMDTEMVLLVGGDTLDYHGYLNEVEGVGPVSFIPSLYTDTGPIVQFAPVDPLYADVNGDNVPDMAIGRFPVRSRLELTQVVTKTLAWDFKDYGQTSLFVADKFDQNNDYDFSGDAEDMISRMPISWQTDLTRAFVDDLGVSDAKVTTIETINGGTALTSFVGHSGPNYWTFDNLFSSQDAVNLTNDLRPTVLTQWGCWNTFFVSETEDTMGHEFLLNGEQGAVAVLGASTLTDAPHERGLAKRLYDHLFVPGVTLGAAILEAKQNYALTAPGHRDVILGWTLLGDPALVMQPE